MRLKQVHWIGDSRARISAFPAEARQEAGYQLERVQAGRDPADWKPMPSVGLGVNEIRVREDGGAFRVFYVVRFAEAISARDSGAPPRSSSKRRSLRHTPPA